MTRSGHLATLALIGVTLAAGASGCGASDVNAKRDFVAGADAVCKRENVAVRAVNAAITTAQRGADPEKVFKDLARLTREGSDTSLRYINQLDALTTPAADRDDLKGWIAAQRRQLTLLKMLSAALAAKQSAQISRLSERIDTLGQSNNSFAANYGMAECAKDS